MGWNYYGSSASIVTFLLVNLLECFRGQSQTSLQGV